MHALLVANEMDEFTVLELRDAYLSCNRNEACKIEARKFVYRQITRLLLAIAMMVKQDSLMSLRFDGRTNTNLSNNGNSNELYKALDYQLIGQYRQKVISLFKI